MIAWLAIACARPPALPPALPLAPCPAEPAPRETVSTESESLYPPVVHVAFGPAVHGARAGRGWPTKPGGAVAPSLSALEAELRARDLWQEDLRALGPRADGVYLVVWWAAATRQHPALDVVWVRPTETLVGLLDRPRDTALVEAAPDPCVSLQVFLVPPGAYAPVGLLYDALP